MGPGSVEEAITALRAAHQAVAALPRQTLTGEPLDPVMPATARARAHGSINAEHV